MASPAELSFDKDGHVYKLTMKVMDIDGLNALAQAENLTAEVDGDKIISTLVGKGKGLFKEVNLFKDNKPHNGPNGEYAHQRFHDNGQLEYALPFIDGLRNGKLRQYTDKGIPVQTSNFKDDYLNDEADGKAAVHIYNNKGQLVYKEHYKEGKLNDTPDGAPARQWFDDSGKLYDALSYTDGDMSKKDGKDIIAEYLKSKQPEQQAMPAAKSKAAPAPPRL